MPMIGNRPQNLLKVAEATDPYGFDLLVAEFIDQWNLDASVERLAEEPLLIGGRFESGTIADTYLAALARHLFTAKGWRSPAWVWKAERFLDRPWFSVPDTMKALAIHQSPPAFRERNLFILEDGLTRV